MKTPAALPPCPACSGVLRQEGQRATCRNCRKGYSVPALLVLVLVLLSSCAQAPAGGVRIEQGPGSLVIVINQGEIRKAGDNAGGPATASPVVSPTVTGLP